MTSSDLIDEPVSTINNSGFLQSVEVMLPSCVYVYTWILAAEVRAQLDHSCSVRLLSFGSYVKDVVCATFGVNYEFIESWKRVDVAPPKMKRTMRELLQHVGDLRTFHPEIWVNKLLSELPESGWVVITDIRYENELQALKEKRVERTNASMTCSCTTSHGQNSFQTCKF